MQDPLAKPDHHRHQCIQCKHVWEHSNECAFTSGTLFRRLHSCPACGCCMVVDGSAPRYKGPLPVTPLEIPEQFVLSNN